MKNQKRQLLGLLGLILILICLPFIYYASQTVQQLLSEATGKKAEIVIDAALTLGPITPVWNSFSQGGEESTDMLLPVVNQIQTLSPKYIRLDHLYDHFNVVNRGSDGQLTFNFSGLDQAVQTILKTNALPFLSLSYMPPALAQNGDITGLPNNWNEWSVVVRKTIEHYSGRSGLNLTNVYYEVWNEPDLFGKWKLYGDKNYLTLYAYASYGAQQATDVNPFYLGGPATTGLYKNWITTLSKHVLTNKLRLDFFSWHRYTEKPEQYSQDVTDITNWLINQSTEHVAIPRLITEWGFNSEMDAGYDNNLAAAHAVASVRYSLYGYQHIFAFEVIDGLDPQGREFWGRWGLITHSRFNAHTKPRYHVFQLLNQMQGTRLNLAGEGTWVSGFAANDNSTIRIILANYDRYNHHIEAVPIIINHLPNGVYILKRIRLNQTPLSQTLTVDNNTLSIDVIMLQNNVVLLELTPQTNLTP